MPDSALFPRPPNLKSDVQPLPPAAPPRWVGPVDLLTVALVVAAAQKWTLGGFQIFAPPFRISMNSPGVLMLAAVTLVLLRHLRVPRPSLVHRGLQTTSHAWTAAHQRVWRVITPVWMTFRLGVLVIGLLAVTSVGLPPAMQPLPATGHPILDLAARWDTGWYLHIATDGYRWAPLEGGQQTIAFFPGYPLLMHVGGAAFGARPKPAPLRHLAHERARRRTLLAGWLIALTASYLALAALYTWASDAVGASAAARSVTLLSAYPFALFYSAAYTESLFLLGVLSAFNSLAAGRAGSAAAWGLAVGLIRPNGFLLALPLAAIAARTGGSRARLRIAAAAPCLGVAAYSGYVWWLTGRPFAWAEAHASWGRTPVTWNSVTSTWQQLSHEGPLTYWATRPIEALNALALLFAAALAPIVWRRLGAAATLFVVVNLVPPLLAGGLMSFGRVTATMFPLFVALSLVVPRRHHALWVGGLALLQALAATLFFTWRPLV